MRIGWWLYFWFIVANLVAIPLVGSFDSSAALAFAFCVISLVGLWGYLKERPIGNRFVWGAVFVSLAICVGYFAVRPFISETPYRTWAFYGAAAGTVLSIPLLLAIWRYSFRSPNIWRRSTAA